MRTSLWSRVISFSHRVYDQVPVYNAKIAVKSEEGDGAGSAEDDGEEWNFIFSPEQVDAEIGLDQFQKNYLSV